MAKTKALKLICAFVFAYADFVGFGGSNTSETMPLHITQSEWFHTYHNVFLFCYTHVLMYENETLNHLSTVCL